MTTKAQKEAQKRYDQASKDKFRMIHLKLNKDADADIIARLEASGNIQGYIKALIRNDKQKSKPKNSLCDRSEE